MEAMEELAEHKRAILRLLKPTGLKDIHTSGRLGEASIALALGHRLCSGTGNVDAYCGRGTTYEYKSKQRTGVRSGRPNKEQFVFRVPRKDNSFTMPTADFIVCARQDRLGYYDMWMIENGPELKWLLGKPKKETLSMEEVMALGKKAWERKERGLFAR